MLTAAGVVHIAQNRSKSSYWAVATVVTVVLLGSFAQVGCSATVPAGSSYTIQAPQSGGPPPGYSPHKYYSSPPPGAHPSPNSKGENTQWHWVPGYTRSNGTYVNGYWRRTK